MIQSNQPLKNCESNESNDCLSVDESICGFVMDDSEHFPVKNEKYYKTEKQRHLWNVDDHDKMTKSGSSFRTSFQISVRKNNQFTSEGGIPPPIFLSKIPWFRLRTRSTDYWASFAHKMVCVSVPIIL